MSALIIGLIIAGYSMFYIGMMRFQNPGAKYGIGAFWTCAPSAPAGSSIAPIAEGGLTGSAATPIGAPNLNPNPVYNPVQNPQQTYQPLPTPAPGTSTSPNPVSALADDVKKIETDVTGALKTGISAAQKAARSLVARLKGTSAPTPSPAPPALPLPLGGLL